MCILSLREQCNIVVNMQLLFTAAMSQVVARNKRLFSVAFGLFAFGKQSLRIDSYRLIYKKNMKEENISYKISSM